MRMSFIALLAVCATLAVAQQTLPRMTTVEPPTGKVGDVLTVAGENLDKPAVTKLFLTDGKNDLEVEVTEQANRTSRSNSGSRRGQGRAVQLDDSHGRQGRQVYRTAGQTNCRVRTCRASSTWWLRPSEIWKTSRSGRSAF